MSDTPDSIDVRIAAMRAHLSAAETALLNVELDNADAACQTALAELRAAKAAHDDYVHGTSHDLRNILTAISGQAQFVNRQIGRGRLDARRLRLSLHQITLAVRQADEIIRRLSSS